MESRAREKLFSRSELITKMLIVSAMAGTLAAVAVLPAVGGAGLITRNGVNSFQNLPADLTEVPLPQQNTILDRNGEQIAVLYAQNRIEVSLEDIAPIMQQAIISIEDQRFLKHAGIDIQGTLRASISTGTGSQVQGGSTITQQYVKQILLTAATTPEQQKAATEVSISRKIREARYAIALENKLSKKEILEGYLNIAYFGAGSYGVEIASRRYFSKHANELTLSEAATLAGLVQNPSRFDPTKYPDLANKRKNLVLNAMVRAGYITGSEAEAAKAKTVAEELVVSEIPNGCTTSEAPFFCDYVLTVLKSDPIYGPTAEDRERLINMGGLTITTTLDLKAQRAAQKAVEDRIPNDDPSRKAAGISMVKPGTGEITAMAQNRTWGRSGAGKTTVNYNVPVDHNGTVGAQAGSTFKTFTMAAALDQGWDPFTVLSAPPKKTFVDFKECGSNAKFAPYDVRNSTSSGSFDMLAGAAYSVNTYFVGLEEKIGLCGPVAMAKKAGVQQGNGQDFESFPCFTLGCFDVTTLDMAEAMATFAAHGVHCEPIALVSIKDRNGKDVAVPSADCEQTIKREVADSVSAMLAGVIDGPLSGRTGQRMSLNRDAAGKTGTTDSSAAVWFVGYTPDLAAAVWVGDPRGGQQYPMKGITINGRFYGQVFGSLMPGPIWKDSMLGALAGTPETKWDLKTMHGLNPGGFGNQISSSQSVCSGIEDETILAACIAAEADPTAIPDPVTGLPTVIDPLTGLPTYVLPSATPKPSASKTP